LLFGQLARCDREKLSQRKAFGNLSSHPVSRKRPEK